MKQNRYDQIDEIIEMAWCDKTAFEDIKTQTNLSESEVINLMRQHLKAQSFKRWRKRVTGRSAKHKTLLSSKLQDNH